MSGGHTAVQTSNERAALLISVSALFPARVGTLAKSVQIQTPSANIEALHPMPSFD